MCGACGANGRVSSSTRDLNGEKLKFPLESLLNTILPRNHTVRAFGDQWILRFPTGKSSVFADIEDLVRTLSARDMLPAEFPAGAAGAYLGLMLYRLPG